MAEKYKRIEDLEAKLCAADDSATSTAVAASRPVAAGSASSTGLELLHTHLTSAESASVAISQQNDTYRERLAT